MRAAVIGAGHIARQHLEALRAQGQDIVGVCDLSAATAEAAAERHGVAAFFTSHREMLEKARPDVVHVATPAASHYGLAVDALEASAHVIVEKPITTRYDDLAKLIELAGQRGLVLLEDHNYLFNRTVQRLLGWVRTGELGDVIHADVVICVGLGEGSADLASHPSLALPGGIIAEYLTHMAYLSYAFVGEHRGLHTSWSKRNAASPLPSDELRALVEAERGSSSLLFSAHAQPDVFLIRVYGTQMTAEAHLFEPRLTCQRMRGPKPLVPVLNAMRESAQQLGGAFRSSAKKLSGGPGAYEGLWELLRRSYAAIEGGAEPPISTRQIAGVNRLVHDLAPEEVGR